MPARAEQMVQDNDSEANGQEYNIRKKIEHAYKSIQYNSIVNICRGTQFYSERFLKFIQTIFPENS
ncbi:unnamed protein product [Miscanthus lutarioriparius]|uniref:PIPK domain-containing protein n=1 Tax=Miscanthus lutarioriparius TaxID=422564 RepID=A0A811S2G3_9POAL|nr:unnamed protein product [Miscanthus lutarioriparius]